MERRPVILPDQPEILMLATLAAVSASKVAAAFNEPLRFFNHLSLEELGRLQAACDRLSAIQTAMAEALEVYATAAREVLNAG